jgi:hypothetical protein
MSVFRLVLDEEAFKGQKIMPLEDVDTFSEDGMHGDYVRFFAVRYPDPQNRGKKRWAIEALFYVSKTPEKETVESCSDGASSVEESSPKPPSKWDVKELDWNYRLCHRKDGERIVDRCTFEEAQVNGQRRLVCCRGESVPLALQEFRYLGADVLKPKDLLHVARQFQASGKMNEQEWHRAFLNFVNEDLDDFTSDLHPNGFKILVTSEEDKRHENESEKSYRRCVCLSLWGTIIYTVFVAVVTFKILDNVFPDDFLFNCRSRYFYEK